MFPYVDQVIFVILVEKPDLRQFKKKIGKAAYFYGDHDDPKKTNC